MTRRERPKISAKEWVDKPDSGFTPTCVRTAKERQWRPKKEGSYRISIVPYTVPAQPGEAGPNPNCAPGGYHYERTYWLHYDIGPNNDSYVCLRKTAGRACPVCDYRDKLERQPDADEKLIKALLPKQRQLWNIRDEDQPGEGVLLWDISYHNFGKQLKEEIRNADEGDGYEFFADPDEGMVVKVFLKETSFAGSNPYMQASSINFKPRPPLPDEVLDQAMVLDEELIVLPYEKLRSIFLQEEGHTDGDDGAAGGAQPPRAPAAPRPRQAAEAQPAAPAAAAAPAAPAAAPQPRPARRAPAAPAQPAAAPAAPTAPAYVRGDEVVYEGEVYMVAKVLDGGMLNLMHSTTDAVVRGVDVADVQPAGAAAPAAAAPAPRAAAPAPAAPAAAAVEEGAWDEDVPFDGAQAAAEQLPPAPQAALPAGDTDWEKGWD